MDAFTIFFLITSALLAALGLRQGIIRRLGSLAGLILGIVVCRLWGHDIAGWTNSLAPDHEWAVTAIAYALTFAIVYFLVTLLAGQIHNAFEAVHLGAANRISGAAFYLIVWWLALSLCINIYIAVSPDTAAYFADGWQSWLAQLAPRAAGYIQQSALNILSEQNVTQL